MSDGVLIIDKPAGMTSHDVVARLRRLLGTKRVGHTGTLDPFATGVLVMLIGKATRLARFLDRQEKEYAALIQFGRETDTGDITGTATNEAPVDLGPINWDDVFERFRGEIFQVPPMYSAKKLKGRKLYELARKGIEVQREPVKLTIRELEAAVPQDVPDPETQLRVRVVCSAGTYIRTLAADIGSEIGTLAHLAELRRIRAGEFAISQASSLEELERNASAAVGRMIQMNDAVSHLPLQRINPDEIRRISRGQSVTANKAAFEGSFIRLADSEGKLIAIGELAGDHSEVRPRIVFV